MIAADINCIYDDRSAFTAEIYTAAAESQSNKSQRTTVHLDRSP